jgi:malate dehydrogenase (oxaloacetate-decarboxylating)(NADP+)
MVEASSLGLANSLTPDERALDLLYPRITRIREISAHIAVEVIRAAQQAVSQRPPTCVFLLLSTRFFAGC